MDKKTLRTIPREKADAELFRMVDSVAAYVKYIVTAHMQDSVLALYFYAVEDLKQGIDTATFRTFHTLDDYISQDLKVEKTKWLTAGFDNMGWEFGPLKYSWQTGYIDQTTFRTLDEKALVEDFFRDQLSDSDKCNPWSAIIRLQRSIRERRLMERHEQELKPTDELMATIGDAPQEFFDWVWDVGMSVSNYLIYKEVEKGIAECECTICKGVGRVERSEIRMRNNETGTCPFCGRPVTFKAKGRMPYKIYDDRYFDYVEPTEDGFLFRVFHAWRDTCGDQAMIVHRMTQGIQEVRRAFYSFVSAGKRVEPIYKVFEWGVYKQRGSFRWCPDVENARCWSNVLYPGNLPEAWAHTPMKYSALEIMAENRPLIPCRYEELIETYCSFPKLEWLIKMGLFYLVMELGGWKYSGVINYKGHTIYQILKIGKVNTRLLQAFEGDPDMLMLLQKIEKEKMYFTQESLLEYFNVFETDIDILRKKDRKASLHKICRYIAREAEHYPLGEKHRYSYRNPYLGEWMKDSLEVRRMRNLAHDWLDYICWCGQLGYDTNNMSVYLPKNFKAVHDRTLEEMKAIEDKKRKAEKKRSEAMTKKILAQNMKELEEIFELNKDADTFSIKGKGLVLVVPKSGEEIRLEGEALHNCLGTYVERVMKGVTNIYFIRKAKEPDVPYFALEYQNGKVIQCRGMNNCDMPAEVQAFVKVFEKKMQEAEERKAG